MTVFVVGYGYIARPPVVTGAYPVTAVTSALKLMAIASVDAMPVPVDVCADVQAPEPIALVDSESVPAAIKIDGAPTVPVLTASAVAMPVPKPETPDEIGKPVAFVNVPEVGVPRTGVVKVGDVDSTMFPVPVTALESVTPPYVSAALIVVARVSVIAPVEVPPSVIVPEPAASTARFSFVPLVITDTATPPAAAADLILMPVADDAVDVST